jgi:hypothetical protein
MRSPISCAQCEQMLSLLNPEELSNVNWNIINKHITSCAKCAFVLKKNRETDALLRSLPAIEPLPELPYELQRLWQTKHSSPLSDDIPAENVYSSQELNGGLKRKQRSSTKRLAAALAMIAIFLATLFASISPITDSSTQRPPAKVPLIDSPAQRLPSYLWSASSYSMFYDLLNSSSQDFWGFGSGACNTDKAGYHVQATEGIKGCLTSRAYSTNFAYEVSVEISQGDSAGIAFFADKAAGVPDYYSFTISSDGTYQLATQNIIVIKGQSNAIKIGLHQTNRIATVTLDDQLYLYANSQLVYTRIGVPSRQGAVGFLAVSDDTRLTEASFTHAFIWT